MGVNPSYTWRSLLAGRTVLCKGIVWKVGDGVSIDIREDPWLPTSNKFRIQDPDVIPTRLQNVSQLICPETRSWDSGLIMQNFSQRDARHILDIPLGSHTETDISFWKPDPRGIFSVKGAYKEAWKDWVQTKIESNRAGYDAYEQMRHHASGWRRIWKLQLPPKMRVFLWRLCKRVLPTKNRLAEKGIETIGGCYLCGHQEESVHHLFLECPYAKYVLNGLDQSIVLNVCPVGEWLSSIHHLILQLNEEKLQKVVMSWYRVWLERNSVWQGKPIKPPGDVAKGAGSELRSILEALVFNQVSKPRRLAQNQWRKPPQNFHKINADAACAVESNSVGIGIVIRNHDGNFVAGKAVAIQGCSEAHRGELIAAREGIKFAWEQGLRNVILEGDAKAVYDSILGDREDLSYNGYILREVVCYASWFDRFDCLYVPRSCNHAADFLANRAKLGEVGVWYDEPPPELVSVLNSDILCY